MIGVEIDRDLTTTEIHAAVLGLSGAVVGAMLAVGMYGTALGLTAPVVAVALVIKKYVGENSKAERMIRREPWYFLAVFVVVVVLAAVTVTTGTV